MLHRSRGLISVMLFLALAATLSIGLSGSTSASGFVTDAAVVDGRCAVIDADLIVRDGGNGDWSWANDQLVYNKVDSRGIYQVYVSDPDGSNAHCISCARADGAPSPGRHKFQPAWHPSGDYIVVQGEVEMHVLEWFRTTPMVTEMLLNGLWSDLYVTTPDGSEWFKLTETATNIHDGVLHPIFSRDGNKLLWSQLIERGTAAHPLGRWKLMVADFVVSGGTPQLKNVRDITPNQGDFFESHGFSPDGRSAIFTADIDSKASYQKQIWSMDLATGKLRNLTPNTHWNEHAVYTPDGDRLTYMSSEPFLWSFLVTELMLASGDGDGPIQLSHFNQKGFPEYTQAQSMATQSSWNASGTKLAVTQQMKDGYPAHRNFWVLTFDGACGGSSER